MGPTDDMEKALISSSPSPLMLMMMMFSTLGTDRKMQASLLRGDSVQTVMRRQRTAEEEERLVKVQSTPLFPPND